MEPSDEELGAFNQSECQRLLEDRGRGRSMRRWAGSGPSSLHLLRGAGAGWTQGARAHSGVLGLQAGILASLGLCFLICKMRNLQREAYVIAPAKDTGKRRAQVTRGTGSELSPATGRCGITEASSALALLYSSVRWR